MIKVESVFEVSKKPIEMIKEALINQRALSSVQNMMRGADRRCLRAWSWMNQTKIIKLLLKKASLFLLINKNLFEWVEPVRVDFVNPFNLIPSGA